MGDHRAIIKIEAEFHGIKEEKDMWINWIEEIPSPVEHFFRKLYDKGMKEYQKQMDEYFAEKHKEEIERAEKTELIRLKNKYEKGA